MFRNYVLIALRNLRKEKSSSIINISGLAIGIACSLLLGYYVQFERSYEQFHVNAENLFRVTLNQFNNGEFVVNDAETYQALGPDLKRTFPEVIDYVRMSHWGEDHLRTTTESFYEDLIYLSDPSVFDLFTIKFVHGDPTVNFSEPNKAVISDRLAQRIFGDTEVIGETILLGYYETPLLVTGVFEALPANTHLKFEMLISHETLPRLWDWYAEYPWSGNNEYTYLLMNPGTSVEAFNQKLNQYSKVNENIENEIVISERIGDIHLYSNKSFEPEVNGDVRIVNFMMMLGIFILLLAWVNYVNLSTAKAINRSKEVGIRKVIGSSQWTLIKQFLIESFVINLSAAILAFTLVQLSMPFFSQLTGQTVQDGFSFNPYFWKQLLLIVVIGTFLSGLYPAFILSSFSPAKVLKGKFSQSTKGRLVRKLLVIFQFTATITLLVFAFTVNQQIKHLQNVDLGVALDNTLVVRRPALMLEDSLYISAMTTFINDASSSVGIKSIASSSALPGVEFHEMGLTTELWPESVDENIQGSYTYYMYDIDEYYFKTLDIKLVAGRNFGREDEDQVIINKRSLELLGYSSAEEAIGSRLIFGYNENERSEIIGVIEDFHQRSPKEEFIPLVFNYTQVGTHYTFKLEAGKEDHVLTHIKSIWEEHFPDAALDYFFLDKRYQQQYKMEASFSAVTSIFTGVFLIIAILGLYGLSSYTILQRKKEIGVRKILGASLRRLISLISKDYLKLVITATLIACPVAYYLVLLWLENYSSRIQISWGLFAAPSTLIIVIAFLSILGQTLKTTTANPVDSLRYE